MLILAAEIVGLGLSEKRWSYKKTTWQPVDFEWTAHSYYHFLLNIVLLIVRAVAIVSLLAVSALGKKVFVDRSIPSFIFCSLLHLSNI